MIFLSGTIRPDMIPTLAPLGQITGAAITPTPMPNPNPNAGPTPAPKPLSKLIF